MRQPEKKRRTVGIRGQLMWFLCFICLLLLVLFWRNKALLAQEEIPCVS